MTVVSEVLQRHMSNYRYNNCSVCMEILIINFCFVFKASALGDLRSNHDPRVTFEGDNTVLLQQTSNWLLKVFSDQNTDFTVYPASEIAFVTKRLRVLQRRFVKNMGPLSDKSTYI